MTAPLPLTQTELDAVPALLAQLRVSFDAYVIGIGMHAADGAITPLRWHADGSLPSDFLDRYKQVASDDVAGFLFATNATSVLAINTTDDFPSKGSTMTGYRMGPYLRNAGIGELLMLGVQSSYDIAWITLYRMYSNGSRAAPFTAGEAEIASYLGRAALFDWQMATQSPSARKTVSGDRYKLVQLTRGLVPVAVRMARGYTAEEIKDDLGGSVRTIETCMSDSLEAFKVGTSKSRRHISDRLLGALPKACGDIVDLRKVDRANSVPDAPS